MPDIVAYFESEQGQREFAEWEKQFINNKNKKVKYNYKCINVYRRTKMVYKTINDVPQEGRRLIIQLLERGVIDSKDGEINIDEVIYKVLIILARLDLI